MRSTARVPERFAEASLHSYQPVTPSQTTALASAMSLYLGKSRSLVMVGPVGVGKTHLAAGVFSALKAEKRQRGPVWVNVPELITDLKSEIGKEDQPAAALAKELRSHPALVVLDDLGREKITDWTGELVYVLINARYEAMLPTLATSNLTPAQLADSGYWPAISRLAEDGALIRIEAKDHRIAKVAS